MVVFLRLLVSRGNNEWYLSSCGRAVSRPVGKKDNPAVQVSEGLTRHHLESRMGFLLQLFTKRVREEKLAGGSLVRQ